MRVNKMGQCVSFFTKKKSKVSPQVDGDEDFLPAPIGLHSAVRAPSENSSNFRSKFGSNVTHSEFGGESFSSSEFCACYEAFFRNPSRVISPQELERNVEAAAAKPVSRKNLPASARNYIVPSKTSRLIQSLQDTAIQQKKLGRRKNGEGFSRMKSDQRPEQSDSILIGGSSQDRRSFSASSKDKRLSLDSFASKSTTSEYDSSLDGTYSELGRSSWAEEKSDAGFDSPSSAGATRNSRPPNKEKFEAPLFIEDLEDMEDWSSDESECHEIESEVEVELSPEREKGPEQLTIRGIPCELHKPKGKSPEVSLSGIFSDEETKEKPPREKRAKRRLDSTPSAAVQHVESQRRVIPNPIKEQEKSTSKKSGCVSFSGVVYNNEELRMVAALESQKRVIPDPIKEQEKSTCKKSECLSFSGVVYNNEELRMMASVQHVESQKRVIPDPIKVQEKSTFENSGCMSFSCVVYSNEELQMMADILGEHDQ